MSAINWIGQALLNMAVAVVRSYVLLVFVKMLFEYIFPVIQPLAASPWIEVPAYIAMLVCIVWDIVTSPFRASAWDCAYIPKDE